MNLCSLAQNYTMGGENAGSAARGFAPLGLPMPPWGVDARRGQGNDHRRKGGCYPRELRKPLCSVTKFSQSLGNSHLALSLSSLFPTIQPHTEYVAIW